MAATGDDGRKRKQFGNRFLTDPTRLFQHNAWDNVEWSEEQEAAAQAKVRENSVHFVPQDQQDVYEVNANEYWNAFYKIHENGFFKDRHWLFTEFPELAPNLCGSQVGTCVTKETVGNASISDLGSSNVHGLDSAENGILEHLNSEPDNDDMIHAEVELGSKKLEEQKLREGDFPGSSATYRILEVGCGAGNTVFPILQINNDPGLFVYCCDFSTAAVNLVKAHPEYDASHCFAFVHDLCNTDAPLPMPEESLDVVVLIFVLSSILPEKMQCVINRLSNLLKPGGMILLRDYGRYDLAQLRFKKGNSYISEERLEKTPLSILYLKRPYEINEVTICQRVTWKAYAYTMEERISSGQCLADNFYVRGDGTRVYFFTQDELDLLFSSADLEKVQNMVDRRLQVNRGKQVTMYRVWIQCKYRKLPRKKGDESVEERTSSQHCD